jgi:hypothetical protein
MTDVSPGTECDIEALLRWARTSGIELFLVGGKLRFSCNLPPSHPLVSQLLGNSAEICEILEGWGPRNCPEGPEARALLDSTPLQSRRDGLRMSQAAATVTRSADLVMPV